jgi:hypothetical protein
MMTAKDKWNRDHYTQIKVWADKSLAAAFKAACTRNGVSYASVITSMMSEYLGVVRPQLCDADRNINDLSRRNDRRKAVRVIVASLEKIQAMESKYMERIPENMQDGERYQTAAQSVELIEEALAALNDAY